MTITIRKPVDEEICPPDWLLDQLNLQDGSLVRATVEDETLHLEQIDNFLMLRGTLASDGAFDEAMRCLPQTQNTSCA